MQYLRALKVMHIFGAGCFNWKFYDWKVIFDQIFFDRIHFDQE